MFFDPRQDNGGLPHSPFKALVAPRPIGWISTRSAEGVANLAPYSFFNAVASRPDMVMFSSAGWKDSVENIRATGEFACNYVGRDMIAGMNASSAEVGPQVSEFDLAGLEMAECRMIAAPRVKAAPAALECRVAKIFEIEDADGNASGHFMVIGQVVGIHIDDAYIRNGRFDAAAAGPVTRLGYMDYGHLGEMFELFRPRLPESADKPAHQG
ncbi:MAG: flavin reductase family protein [Nitratireductor sp.]|nr:flavin reductase family protein [Nitratireductor sp.]